MRYIFMHSIPGMSHNRMHNDSAMTGAEKSNPSEAPSRALFMIVFIAEIIYNGANWGLK